MNSDPIPGKLKLAERTVTALLLLVAFGHAVPALAFFDAGRLQALYGIGEIDANLEVLLRHRALLFGITAGILALGAFRPAYRTFALTVGWLSVVSFIFLEMSVTGVNSLLHRVAMVDLVLGAALVLATGLSVASARRAR